MLDIWQGVHDLNDFVQNVYVVEWRGEVRELLFHLKNEKNVNPEIKAILLDDQGKVEKQFVSSKTEEEASVAPFSFPQKYLLEPSPAVMKSGLFKTLATTFNLHKLHQNTQLYTSSELPVNFPGRSFEIVESISVNKKALKKVLPDLKANLSTRNFPMPVSDLKKKLGLKDGGDKYLFACTLEDETKRLLLCKKA